MTVLGGRDALVGAVLAALLGLAACGGAAAPGGAGGAGGGAPGGAPTLAGCEVFPADHVWNARIDHLPVHPLSDDFVAAIGLDSPVHPDFGAGLWEGAPIGIPYAVVGAGQPLVDVSFRWPDESDPGPYPVPPDAPVEGAPPGGVAPGGDRHVLVLDSSTCRLYELFAAVKRDDGSWEAGSGAVFDLGAYDLRPDGWTSADAAGLPILPGLVRYDEVAAGAVRHALRFTAPRTRAAHVWPARHHASALTDERYPPMGQRFRLREDFDASGFSPEAQAIVAAMKRYGIVLADNGSPWFLSGAPDERWDDQALRDLRRIRGSDLEAVDVSSLMAEPGSGRVR
ncbi:MAG TPA: hypothetical protein VFF08_05790 [Trueperaceae bacterium]|nr:hypothetical protein [Trueperaceae bacterium]